MSGKLYTIGHSNHTLGWFIEMLKRHEIGVLVDVRAKPFSRWQPQFNRFALREELRARGIEYKYAGKVLGGFAKVNPVSVDAPEFVEKMTRLRTLLETKSVALVCSEKEPAHCHRATKLALYAMNRWEMQVDHILADGSTVDAQVYQDGCIVDANLWHELDERGHYGLPGYDFQIKTKKGCKKVVDAQGKLF